MFCLLQAIFASLRCVPSRQAVPMRRIIYLDILRVMVDVSSSFSMLYYIIINSFGPRTNKCANWNYFALGRFSQ